MMQRVSPQWSAVIVVGLFLSGCSNDRPEIVPVSGQVLIDGKPLSHGSIQFTPVDSRPSYSNLDEDGRFVLTCRDQSDGAVVGRHQVTIEGKEVLSSTDTMIQIRWHAPKKYADATTSEITQDITGPTSDLVINLDWEGGRPFLETIHETPEPPPLGPEPP